MDATFTVRALGKTIWPYNYASAVRWRKARRTATALLIAAPLALAGAVFIAWTGYTTHRQEQLMQAQRLLGAL